MTETTSESRYEELEPWIQWVTAHTGMTLAEHGVFRLGDITRHELPQIWERLEAKGLHVGAVSPMNASCRMVSPAFFVPDPWTTTKVVAPPVYQRLYRAIAQAVSENADMKLSTRSILDIATGGLRAASPANYVRYARYALGARGHPWRRAMFLDLLLADVFIDCIDSTAPDFASLFLNAGAHIQHHYLFSSQAYRGAARNPDWYVSAAVDPLLEVYELYDVILARLMQRYPTARIMLATGLHQDPHTDTTYYWRLRNHAALLERLEIPYRDVIPLMSRDFTVVCSDTTAAAAAAERLGTVRASDGQPLFEVDNRGTDLFVMLTYPTDIGPELSVVMGNINLGPLRPLVSFVAIKNGAHNGIGYFSDSGLDAANAPQRIALASLPDRIEAALGV